MLFRSSSSTTLTVPNAELLASNATTAPSTSSESRRSSVVQMASSTATAPTFASASAGVPRPKRPRDAAMVVAQSVWLKRSQEQKPISTSEVDSALHGHSASRSMRKTIQPHPITDLETKNPVQEIFLSEEAQTLMIKRLMQDRKSTRLNSSH